MDVEYVLLKAQKHYKTALDSQRNGDVQSELENTIIGLELISISLPFVENEAKSLKSSQIQALKEIKAELQERKNFLQQNLSKGPDSDNAPEMVPEVTFPISYPKTKIPVIGLKKEMAELWSSIKGPAQHPKYQEKFDFDTQQRSFLLYGIPGNGKTLIARSIAAEAELPLIRVSGSSLLSKFIGESERLIASAFSFAKKHQPCIIFFDEFDGIAVNRGQSESSGLKGVMSELLIQFSSLVEEQSKIVIFCATNRPQDLDPGAIRRFDVLLHVKNPSESERVDLMKLRLNGFHNISDYQFGKLSKMMNQYSCADVVRCVDRAIASYYKEAWNATTFCERRDSSGQLYYEPNTKASQVVKKMAYQDLPPDSLFPRKISFEVLQSCIRKSSPRASHGLIREMNRFSRRNIE